MLENLISSSVTLSIDVIKSLLGIVNSSSYNQAIFIEISILNNLKFISNEL